MWGPKANGRQIFEKEEIINLLNAADRLEMTRTNT